MWQVLLFFIVIGVIAKFIEWIFIAVPYIFFYGIVPLIVIVIVFLVMRSVYFFFNPEAKARHLKQKREQQEIQRDLEVKKKRDEKAKQARKDAKEKEARERSLAEAKAAKEMRLAEERRRIEEENNKELARIQHRDADVQNEPYTYQVGQHANESLAIRYGIANQKRKINEYWYYAPGGEKMRNKDRDRVYYVPAETIRLKKVGRLSKDLYSVLLTDYRDREAKAVIEVGTEYVKTFYPIDDGWFEKHKDLENTLKGSNTFTLKELATFHVQKTIQPNG